MTEELKRRLSNLLSVKSIITLVTTAVFAYQAITNAISQEFMNVYTLIIAFYFSIQTNKTGAT